jgi:uncharacterized membrane protein
MKISSCLLASGFVFASFYSIIMANSNKYSKKFVKLLDEKQLQIYKKIQSERLYIYLQGQILGSLMALFYLFYYGKGTKYSSCYFALITYVITIGYYTITKKSTLMRDHLITQEQKDAFTDVSRQMMYYHTFGFVLGMIGYILIARIAKHLFSST